MQILLCWPAFLSWVDCNFFLCNYLFILNTFSEFVLDRMQDTELMHMRYALESTVLALVAMERTSSGERASHHQLALCHLKDLRNHLEAITNIPRKVISGLHFA